MQSPLALKSLHVLDVDYKYLDSGSPSSPNYTTWVFVHGMGFNAAVFEKLLPLAHAHNLRIVSLYRRGYPPSTGFHDAELAGIGPGKKLDKVEPFLRGQGTEIATFLVNFARTQNIPVAASDPDSSGGGGIVLIGWSLGTVHVLAVLAYFDTLPEDARSTLQKYLHTVLVHDIVPFALGITPPEQDVSLWLETDDRKRFNGFADWVTAHFSHKSITSENADDLEFDNPSPSLPRSMHELSDARRARYTQIEPFLRTGCDTKLTFCDVGAFATFTKYALFDKARAGVSPRVRVRFMAGGTGSGVFIWALWMIRKYSENPPEELYGNDAKEVRDVKFMIQTEGNHFIFWEDPEKAIQQYSAAIGM